MEEAPDKQDLFKAAARRRFEEWIATQVPAAPQEDLCARISGDHDGSRDYVHAIVESSWRGYLACYMSLASSLEAAEMDKEAK